MVGRDECRPEAPPDMTEIDSDGGSVLVTGPSPNRFQRAAEQLTGEVVVVPEIVDDLEAELASTGIEDLAVTPAEHRSEPSLSELGIALSDLVADRDGPDVLIAVDCLAASGSIDPYSLFRFLHLTRWRVTVAGGRLVCTIGDEVDPITVETIDEVFDHRVRLESLRDRRAVGGLSP